MKLGSLSLAMLAACSTVAAAPSTPTVTASAGDLAASPAPDRDAAAIAKLRAEGPSALARLLADWDKQAPGAARDALAATIDKVAAQRFATASRLYWYTDLDQAKAAARPAGKPILSLRMLGRLDEDLSCANSRFFRTTLYPDAAVQALLRDKFVLYWSSERQVPKITIDFGDGRSIQTTVTGNSAHYVLDADGRPLDVLPGLYAPAVFVKALTADVALARSLVGKIDDERTAALVEFHRRNQAALDDAWHGVAGKSLPIIVGGGTLMSQATIDAALAAAQRATVSKAYVEVPMLQTVDVGADPGTIAPDDVAMWTAVGQQLFNLGAPPAPVTAGSKFDAWTLNGGVRLDTQVAAKARAKAKAKAAGKAAPARSTTILDPRARALVDGLLAAPTPGVPALDALARDRVIARLEQAIVADTAQNELRLRTQIRSFIIARLESHGPFDFDELNTWIYAQVFHTPAYDAWLGLLPRDVFTGLAGGAVVATGS